LSPNLPSLTTGTFNLVVKEPNRYRLSGRFQSSADLLVWGRVLTRPVGPKPDLHRHKPACPRNLYKLRVLRGNCQPVAITGFPPVFHSRGALRFYIWAVPMWDRVSDPVRSSKARLSGAVSTRQNASSSRLVAHRTMPFRHKPRRKTISLIKDHLEVLAHVRLESLTYRTLRGTLSPNEAPWPGLICRN
jgi:hypothetical protein